MIQNEIISEIRQIREEYAQRFNFNLKAMCADLRARQAKSGQVLVRFPPKRANRYYLKLAVDIRLERVS